MFKNEILQDDNPQYAIPYDIESERDLYFKVHFKALGGYEFIS